MRGDNDSKRERVDEPPRATLMLPITLFRIASVFAPAVDEVEPAPDSTFDRRQACYQERIRMRRVIPVLAVALVACASVQATPHRDAAPKISTGAVEIRTGIGAESTIIIAIDEVREGQRDGMADSAYVYFSASSVPVIRHVFDVAVIEDFGDRIIVSGSGKRLIFANHDAKAIPPREDGATFTDGIGIGRYADGHVAGMRIASESDATRVGCGGEDGGPCYSDWSLGGGGGSGSCPGGGLGATSCSSSCPGFSCSVTCGAGYYACCSCMYCKCVKG